jgi:hypothetical protein
MATAHAAIAVTLSVHLSPCIESFDESSHNHKQEQNGKKPEQLLMKLHHCLVNCQRDVMVGVKGIAIADLSERDGNVTSQIVEWADGRGWRQARKAESRERRS